MTKMTSAYANKVLKKLNDDKDFYLNKEQEGQIYVAALDEEPVIPDYDYVEVSAKIAEIDGKIIKIKHAINVTNATSKIAVEGVDMTIDSILVKMAQVFEKQKAEKQKTLTRNVVQYLHCFVALAAALIFAKNYKRGANR